MNSKQVLIGICSLSFLMIGADKFLMFLEPQCSLMSKISSEVWYLLGALQLLAGVLIWIPKFRKVIAGFFILFLLTFVIIHLSQRSYDIGGAIFIACLLGILFWNPSFINSNKANHSKI